MVKKAPLGQSTNVVLFLIWRLDGAPKNLTGNLLPKIKPTFETKLKVISSTNSDKDNSYQSIISPA